MTKEKIRTVITYSYISLCILVAVTMSAAIVFFIRRVDGAFTETLEVPFKMNVKRIPQVYKKAGFKGKVTRFENQSGMHNQRISYTYTEGTGKDQLSYDFYFSIGRDEKVKAYTYQDIVDLYTGKKRSDTNDNFLFATFFDKALFDNKGMEIYQENLVKSLESAGLKKVKVYFDDYDSELNQENINQELKKDLEKANRNGYVPVYGINTLDSFKYFRLGASPLVISTNSKLEDFVEVADKLDKNRLKPGYYRILNGSFYAEYVLDNHLQWHPISSKDSGS